MIKEINFENLDNIYRFSNIRMIERESDLTHSARMCCKALGLINYLDNLGKGDLLDRQRLLYQLFIHDLDELASCDIPRDFKYYNEEITKAIKGTTREIMSKSGISERLIKEAFNAKNFNDIYGFLVFYFDLESAFDKLHFEYCLQHTNQIRKRFIESIQWYSKCFSKRGELTKFLNSCKVDEDILKWINDRKEYRRRLLEDEHLLTEFNEDG